MYVCICNAVTERAIREAAAVGRAHARRAQPPHRLLRTAAAAAPISRSEILDETHRTRTLDLPLIAIAA